MCAEESAYINTTVVAGVGAIDCTHRDCTIVVAIREVCLAGVVVEITNQSRNFDETREGHTITDSQITIVDKVALCAFCCYAYKSADTDTSRTIFYICNRDVCVVCEVVHRTLHLTAETRNIDCRCCCAINCNLCRLSILPILCTIDVESVGEDTIQTERLADSVCAQWTIVLQVVALKVGVINNIAQNTGNQYIV